MKKIGIFMCTMALAGLVFTSCDPKKDNKPDIDNIVEDGFYAVGEACPIKSVDATDAVKAQMAQGINEVLMDQDKKTWEESKRDGMWEKYIYLEGGKEFSLVLKEGVNSTIYGANLEKKELNTDYLPIEGYWGSLVIGQQMKVEESGVYHIILDLNKDGKLDLVGKEQIIVVPVNWVLNGDAAATVPTVEVKSATEVVWSFKDVDFSAASNFKFKDPNAWKLVLDQANTVKAHANLGANMQNGGADIALESMGTYDVTLTFNMAKGEIANSFSYEAVCTQAVEVEHLYMIGADFGSWNWEDAGVVDLTQVNGSPTTYWCTRYVSAAANGFKFAIAKEWESEFTPETAEGVTKDGDGNFVVAEPGLYTMVVDVPAKTLKVTKAEVYGIGDSFGGWDEATYPFTVNADGTASITTTAAGNLRIYTNIGLDLGNWWKSEYNLFDGQIVYRGTGGDQAAVAVSAGQTVTLNFNAGTGTIQ